jgi:murein DD-endopeptidase MepM/ murein hydrolase activator NlpD
MREFKKNHKLTFCHYLIVVLTIGILSLVSINVSAAPADEIKQKIDTRSEEIKKLEAEIKQYEGELDTTSKQARTLENTIKTYDLSIKKFATDINLTGRRIDEKTATLEELAAEISLKETSMERTKRALSLLIKQLDAAEATTLLEAMLSHDTLGEFWDKADGMQRLEGALRDELGDLRLIREQLANVKGKEEGEHTKLVTLKRDLDGKKIAVEETKQEKKGLLNVTKNKEQNYKTLLDEKRAQKEAFEREMFALEAALKLAVDPSRLPDPGTSALVWPLDKVIITQYFGDTSFSKTNPQLYGGKGHNGIDFGAPHGTPIKAALAAVVEATGNTDAVPGCYSYGKWVLLRHGNGLSTLYAHLSSINVTDGQSVATGDIIGYSGNTGYSTGPHLHFGLYATQGVRVMKFEKSINCKNAVIPIADFKAYLNPLAYLPPV